MGHKAKRKKRKEEGKKRKRRQEEGKEDLFFVFFVCVAGVDEKSISKKIPPPSFRRSTFQSFDSF